MKKWKKYSSYSREKVNRHAIPDQGEDQPASGQIMELHKHKALTRLAKTKTSSSWNTQKSGAENVVVQM